MNIDFIDKDFDKRLKEFNKELDNIIDYKAFNKFLDEVNIDFIAFNKFLDETINIKHNKPPQRQKNKKT